MVNRKNMKRYLLCGAMAFVLMMTVYGVDSRAGENPPTVVVEDEAGLLMEEEVDWLETEAKKVADKSDWNMVIATCEDADGDSAQNVCQKFFNEFTHGENGISCLIDMDNREIEIATAGNAIWYLNDERIDEILDEAYEAVSKEDYAQCLYLMILRSGEMFDKGIPKDAYAYDEDTGKVIGHKERDLTVAEIIFAVLAALAAGVIVFVGILGKYRLKWGVYKYDFHESGSFSLENSEDRFINQTVTRRHIPTNNERSSKGGRKSSVSRGSDGRSFGGDGRKF